MSEAYNPSFPLKPVWVDQDYIGVKASGYRAKWQSVSPDQFTQLAAQCDKVVPNIKAALFGYKGTYLVNERPHPRNVLCFNSKRTECWADMASLQL